MANPWRGEVALRLDGELRVAKLTLGALAELEAELGTGTLVELAERFEAGRFAARDVLLLIVAGLRGGGWEGTEEDPGRLHGLRPSSSCGRSASPTTDEGDRLAGSHAGGSLWAWPDTARILGTHAGGIDDHAR